MRNKCGYWNILLFYWNKKDKEMWTNDTMCLCIRRFRQRETENFFSIFRLHICVCDWEKHSRQKTGSEGSSLAIFQFPPIEWIKTRVDSFALFFLCCSRAFFISLENCPGRLARKVFIYTIDVHFSGFLIVLISRRSFFLYSIYLLSEANHREQWRHISHFCTAVNYIRYNIRTRNALPRKNLAHSPRIPINQWKLRTFTHFFWLAEFHPCTFSTVFSGPHIYFSSPTTIPPFSYFIRILFSSLFAFPYIISLILVLFPQ